MKKLLFLCTSIVMWVAAECLAQDSDQGGKDPADRDSGSGVLTAAASVMYDFLSTAGLDNIQPSVFLGYDRQLVARDKAMIRLRVGPSVTASTSGTSLKDHISALLHPGSLNATIMPYFQYKLSDVSNIEVYIGIGGRGTVYNLMDADGVLLPSATLWSASAKAAVSFAATGWLSFLFDYKISYDAINAESGQYDAVFGVQNPLNGTYHVAICTYLEKTGSYFFIEYRNFMHGAIWETHKPVGSLSIGIRQDMDVAGMVAPR